MLDQELNEMDELLTKVAENTTHALLVPVV